jgi:hypothetical protein
MSLLVDALAYRNRYGLLLEDIDPKAGRRLAPFLSDARPDFDGDAVVARMGGRTWRG